MAELIRMAVVDDHPLLRLGVEHIFRQEPDFELVGSGSSGDDAIRIAREHAPDLMLLDVSMPGGGLEAALAIREACPDIKIVFLTVSEREEDVSAALDAGARGYILKGIGGPDLVRTVRQIAAGETFITPEFAVRLLATSGGRLPKSPTGDAQPAQKLNTREEQVLRELSLGLTNKEIARKLNLTEKTIKHYMTGLMQKLNVRNRVEAVLASRRTFGDRSRS